MHRHIVATARLRAPHSVVEEIFHRNPGRVLSDRDRLDNGPKRTIRTSLTVQLGSGTAIVQDVTIDLGTARTSDGSLTVPLCWNPVGHERLLPGFVGELSITESGTASRQLTISGSYEAPLGRVGRVGDALIGLRVGRGTLDTLAELLARRVDDEAERQQTSISYRPAPYNEDLRDSIRHGHHAG